MFINYYKLFFCVLQLITHGLINMEKFPMQNKPNPLNTITLHIQLAINIKTTVIVVIWWISIADKFIFFCINHQNHCFFFFVFSLDVVENKLNFLYFLYIYIELSIELSFSPYFHNNIQKAKTTISFTNGIEK